MVLRKAALVAALAATAGAWSCNDPGAETLMTLTSLKATDAGAVCNDGTPAAYYFAPGSPSSKTFLVYLSGGGQCYDAASCAGRGDGSLYPHHNCSTSDASKPCFLSSKDYGATCNKTGIFSEDPAANRPLHGAHKAYVPYCSSDAHMGDGEQFGLQFRGRRIVDAVLAAQPAGEGRPGQAVARVGVADRPPQRLAVVVRLVRSSALRDAVVEGAAVDARRDPALELRVELVGVDVDVEGAAAREGVDRGLDAGQRGPGPESVEVDDDVDDVVLPLLQLGRRRREGRLRRLREGALLLELGQRPRRRARRAQGPRPRVLAVAGLAGDDLVVRVVVAVLPLLVAERRAHGAPRAAPNDGRSSSPPRTTAYFPAALARQRIAMVFVRVDNLSPRII